MAEPTPAEYFEQVIAQQFAAALANAPEAADQPELTATYEITGTGGGTYSLRTAGARVEVLPGGPADGTLQPGDILTHLNGKLVSEFEPLEQVTDDTLGGTVDDIVTAPRKARRYNERHRELAVVPVVHRDAGGVALVGRF